MTKSLLKFSISTFVSNISKKLLAATVLSTLGLLIMNFVNFCSYPKYILQKMDKNFYSIYFFQKIFLNFE